MFGQDFVSKLSLGYRNTKVIQYTMIGKALEYVAQVGCRCSISGGIQGQAGCGSGQPSLVVDDPAHGRGVETQWSLWFFSTSAIQWFYDTMGKGLKCMGTYSIFFPKDEDSIHNSILCIILRVCRSIDYEYIIISSWHFIWISFLIKFLTWG